MSNIDHVSIAQQPLKDKPDAQRTVRKARPWVERLGRYGYGTRGVVYILVSILAALEASGYRRTGALSGRSALLIIAAHRFGTVILIAVAIGFFGFGSWQLFSGLLLPMTKRRSFWRIVGKRFARVCSGIGQYLLAFGAIGLIINAHRVSEDAEFVGWTAWTMSYPFGRVVVFATGVGVAIFGMTQIYRGWRKKFGLYLDPSELRDGVKSMVTHLGRFGLMSRGLVFCLVGAFLIYAAIERNPREAHGLGGALHAVEMHHYGPWLLGVVAIGLFGYGSYLLVGSKYCAFRLD